MEKRTWILLSVCLCIALFSGCVVIDQGSTQVSRNASSSIDTEIPTRKETFSTSQEKSSKAAIEILPRSPIPRENNGELIATWALFLVCNPAWLHERQEIRLRDLYQQHGAFGTPIGSRHLAVWFRPASGQIGVDAERSGLYCGRFALLPSKSPYVLVTTKHPDDISTLFLENYVLISFNNADPDDVSFLLSRLTDQLLVEGLSQEALLFQWRERFRQKILENLGYAIIRHLNIRISTKEGFAFSFDGSKSSNSQGE